MEINQNTKLEYLKRKNKQTNKNSMGNFQFLELWYFGDNSLHVSKQIVQNYIE